MPAFWPQATPSARRHLGEGSSFYQGTQRCRKLAMRHPRRGPADSPQLFERAHAGSDPQTQLLAISPPTMSIVCTASLLHKSRFPYRYPPIGLGLAGDGGHHVWALSHDIRAIDQVTAASRQQALPIRQSKEGPVRHQQATSSRNVSAVHLCNERCLHFDLHPQIQLPPDVVI